MEDYEGEKHWALYSFDLPFQPIEGLILAPNLSKACEIALKGIDLAPGALMLVSNRTESWLAHSQDIARKTWALMSERDPGQFVYDHDMRNWVRITDDEQ